MRTHSTSPMHTHLYHHPTFTPLMPLFFQFCWSCFSFLVVLSESDGSAERMCTYWQTYLPLTKNRGEKKMVCVATRAERKREEGLNESERSLTNAGVSEFKKQTGRVRGSRRPTRHVQSSWFVRFWFLSLFLGMYACLYLDFSSLYRQEYIA